MSLEETEHGFSGSLNFNTDLFRPETAARMIGALSNAAGRGHRRSRAAAGDAAAVGPRGAADALGRLERRPRATSRGTFASTSCSSRRSSARRTRWPWWMVRASGPIASWTSGRTGWPIICKRGAWGRTRSWPSACLRVAELIVGLWGVLKAGGAYLPLDPKLPAERLAFHAGRRAGRRGGDPRPDARRFARRSPARGLSGYRLAANRPLSGRAAGAGRRRDDQLAYVIYTSGSTGQPKGVMIEHRALVNYAHAVDRPSMASPRPIGCCSSPRSVSTPTPKKSIPA